jgi:tRNA pseudouridine38-40 synthase
MERYQLILAYDGTDFAGSQRQAGARTVQAVVEAALRKLGWQGSSILLAGRTDAGVHASGQVIAFDLAWPHAADTLQRALNALLPADVAVQAVSTAARDFHPRYSALGRVYRYRLLLQPWRDPLVERYAWRVWPPPALERMQAESSPLAGGHDFAAFGRSTRPGGSTIREVKRAAWQSQGQQLIFEIEANAFLYHMVRRIVFALVAVGQGRLEAGTIARAVQAPQNSRLQGLAPAQGLALLSVCYPSPSCENDVIQISNQQNGV